MSLIERMNAYCDRLYEQRLAAQENAIPWPPLVALEYYARRVLSLCRGLVNRGKES